MTAGTGRRSRESPIRCSPPVGPGTRTATRWSGERGDEGERASQARRRRGAERAGSRPVSIVLGYDETPGAKRALGYAIDLARLLGDTLVLVYGAEPPGRMGEEFTAHLAALAERGKAALEHAVQQAAAAGVATVVELVDEKP